MEVWLEFVRRAVFRRERGKNIEILLSSFSPPLLSFWYTRVLTVLCTMLTVRVCSCVSGGLMVQRVKAF